MVPEMIRKIADAILYEGYLLYPYRRSALKNQWRWMFGVVYPEPYCRDPSAAENSFMQTECLVTGTPQSWLEWTVRFHQCLGDEVVEHEAVGTAVLSELVDGSKVVPFSLATGSRKLAGSVTTSAELAALGVFKLRVRIKNESVVEPDAERADALALSMISTHTVLGVDRGEFVSLLDPPPDVVGIAADCRNIGTWPVLVGAPGERRWLLSSPILLYDHPRIAAESPGDYFDGTEIDELLTLRIRTMTDREKEELSADIRARGLLDRTENLSPDELLGLHGTMRRLEPQPLKPGDRVRLKPRIGGAVGTDVFDLVLAGKTAIVQAVEVDLEGRQHVAVIVEDDPGFDFGAEGKPGHRFFFRLEEVEPMTSEGAS